MICPSCRRDFPAHLLTEMAIKPAGENLRYELKCPCCALALMNEMHGFPKGTPFTGTNAARMHMEALAHLQASGQEATK
jgi:hypothetical protein